MILIISPKNVYASLRLVEECKKQNLGCKVLSVEDLLKMSFKINISKYDLLYIRSAYLSGDPRYVEKIILLAKTFVKTGKKVVDANIADGDLGKGKWENYKRLTKAKIQIPKTELFKDFPLKAKRCPLILKWIYGFKAKGTFVIRSEKDIKKIPLHIPKKELMLQEYIEADFEYKVVTVGYKALPVVLRFGYNKKLGRVEFGSAQPLYLKVAEARGLHSRKAGQGPALQQVISLAQKASKTLGRELAKVDILQKGKKFYVLEVNRFPGLKSFEEFTKYSVFKRFVEYLHK